jgi:hypothetical protein
MPDFAALAELVAKIPRATAGGLLVATGGGAATQGQEAGRHPQADKGP